MEAKALQLARAIQEDRITIQDLWKRVGCTYKRALKWLVDQNYCSVVYGNLPPPEHQAKVCFLTGPGLEWLRLSMGKQEPAAEVEKT